MLVGRDNFPLEQITTPPNTPRSHSTQRSLAIADRAKHRQLVSHKALLVNGKPVNIPSYIVKAGDTISITDKSKKQVRIQESLSLSEQTGFPNWVEVNAKEMQGIYKTMPERGELSSDINEQLVVEFYSK